MVGSPQNLVERGEKPLWCLKTLSQPTLTVNADLGMLDAIGGAEEIANGNVLAVEERHDGRAKASDNELLASLIRRKHSKFL